MSGLACLAGPSYDFVAERRNWAFRSPADSPVPKVNDASWARSPIDHFILAKLEANGLRPAPPADRGTLIRRATFDLTGLPPTPEQVAAFLADQSPNAFAKVVDQLLTSPQYGEHWGRHWLDLVRYADSVDKRQIGQPGDINEAYRYRDWVVKAFNEDMPYDQFVMNQFAGDLLPGNGERSFNADGIVATSMLAIGRWEQGEADKEKMMTDIVDDQIDVTGRTFLGLTLACARCHDHKFDPIPTRDYYSLAGIFFSSHIIPEVGSKGGDTQRLRIPLDSPAELDRRKQREAQMAELKKQIDTTIDHEFTNARGREEILSPVARGLIAEARMELAGLQKSPPSPLTFAHGVGEGGVPQSAYAGIQDAKVQVRGRYDRLGETVPRRFPQLLAGDGPPPIMQGSGRLELARWIASSQNPLTARVMVNRIWQFHFGEGIVRTPGNFGKLGLPPTHPELLDYLAHRFVESGWSMKAMHRAIMLSSVYQQSSVPNPETLKTDPDNKLFGRMNRQRLTVEALRDSLLAASGSLDLSLGGAPIREIKNNRRTLYLMTVRSDADNFRCLFDAADPTAIVEQRAVSTVAPQAIFLLNSPFVLEQAKILTRRVLETEGIDDPGRIEWLYRRLHCHQPSATRAGRAPLEFQFPARGLPRHVGFRPEKSHREFVQRPILHPATARPAGPAEFAQSYAPTTARGRQPVERAHCLFRAGVSHAGQGAGSV